MEVASSSSLWPGHRKNLRKAYLEKQRSLLKQAKAIILGFLGHIGSHPRGTRYLHMRRQTYWRTPLPASLLQNSAVLHWLEQKGCKGHSQEEREKKKKDREIRTSSSKRTGAFCTKLYYYTRVYIILGKAALESCTNSLLQGASDFSRTTLWQNLKIYSIRA